MLGSWAEDGALDFRAPPAVLGRPGVELRERGPGIDVYLNQARKCLRFTQFWVDLILILQGHLLNAYA